MLKFNGNRIRDVVTHLLIWATMLGTVSYVIRIEPAPDIDRVIATYSGQIAVAVGGRTSWSGDIHRIRRNYILLPSLFYDPKFIEVQQLNQDPPQVSEHRTECILAISVFGVLCFFYFRRRWTEVGND